MYLAVDLDKALEESILTTWNAKVVDYDNDRFPFNEWILKRIQLMGYPLDDLTKIHEVIPDGEVYKVTKQLCADTNLPEYKRMVNDFVRDVVVPKGKLELPVAVQRFHNVRIMLPNKPEGIFPFHTGLLYGHGPASRSLWMPLTDVRADEDYTASMQILSVERSRELIQEAIDQKMTVPQMSEHFRQDSWPLKCGPGSLCFFGQENIHGNFVNVSGKTRVSIDFRLAEARFGDQLARKIAGGYFKIIPNTAEEEDSRRETDKSKFHNGKRNLHYLNNSTASTFGIPVHLQRYMLHEYSHANKLNFEFELFELEDMKHLPTLQHIVDDYKCNAVLYSVFSLPEDADFRKAILDKVLENETVMHFVNEDMAIVDEQDREDVERLLAFAKHGTSYSQHRGVGIAAIPAE